MQKKNKIPKLKKKKEQLNKNKNKNKYYINRLI